MHELCGCGAAEHADTHDGPHDHEPSGDPRLIALEQDVLAKNDRLAARNRVLFVARNVAAFNFTSAPGSGKTALLQALIRQIGGRVPLAVIEGDQESTRDADRIRSTGAPVVQINTHTGCHLDAQMINAAITALDPLHGSLLLIENVGNLVCPALFDLGERAKVVILSVTEGEDKPLKYPHMFRAAGLVVLTKTDLLPHLDFDIDQCLANIRRVNPEARLFQVSTRTGAGMGAFCDFMASQVAEPRS